MRTLRTVSEVRAALRRPRSEGRRIGLVPTMGAFHEGHASLFRRAHQDCDEVVVSLFVNPAQFNDRADLVAYPRDERRDAAIAAELRVDYLFAPTVEEIYPHGFSTSVSVGAISEVLEGEHRGREHFDGVATVVTKLFNIIAPDIAYFGQKDAQQTLVIRRLAEDLNLPVEVEVCPTVREPDGLAMSSRNQLLSPGDRARAAALNRSLQTAQALVAAGQADVRLITAAAETELRNAAIQPEYVQIVDPDTFAPLARIDRPALAVVAARVGTVRLIDNQMLSPSPR